MKTYSVIEALNKLKGYCAYQERCHKEVKNKLRDMGMIKEAINQIIGTLVAENYLNETRFAKQFTRGKFFIKHWGKLRIVQELKIRAVSDYDIRKAIEVIEAEEYLEKINMLSNKRWKQLSGYSLKVKKQKLYQYLAYRGWEPDLIYKNINLLSKNNYSV